MANPIAFKPLPIDPHMELMRRVEAAPRDHAEALLVAWDLLQTAHDQGILDLLQGLVGGRDVISGKLAEMAKSEDGVNLIRNMIAGGRIIASIDPNMMQRLGKVMDYSTQAQALEKKPPSVFRLLARLFSADALRGLSFMTHLLTQLGRAMRNAS